MIAGRGKGKSTLVRHLLLTRNPKNKQELPKSGSSETTTEPKPYQLEEGVHLWDMPGLGGKLVKNFYHINKDSLTSY